MKKFIILSVLALVSITSSCHAVFTIKNMSKVPLALLLDYEHKDHFEYHTVADNVPFTVSFGLQRIIAWRQDKPETRLEESSLKFLDTPGTIKTVSKKTNYPFQNCIVIDEVSGSDTEKKYKVKDIEEAMHGRHQVKPGFAIVTPEPKKNESPTLALREAAIQE